MWSHRCFPNRSRVVPAAFALLFAGACQTQSRAIPGRVEISSAAEEAELTRSLHERLVHEAETDYSWGDEYKPSIPVAAGTLDGTAGVADLHAWARTMTPNNAPSPGARRFVGLFFSDKRYRKLGMGKDENYVLMVPVPGDTMYIMVPSDLKLPMTLLDYDKNSTFNHSQHDAPQVVHEKTGEIVESGRRMETRAIGGCVEGPCPTRHCGLASSGEALTFTRYQELMRAH